MRVDMSGGFGQLGCLNAGMESGTVSRPGRKLYRLPSTIRDFASKSAFTVAMLSVMA